jgi:hypothetical protein
MRKLRLRKGKEPVKNEGGRCTHHLPLTLPLPTDVENWEFGFNSLIYFHGKLS